MLLFSDGDDQSSHATFEAAVARAESSDATIYVIGQGRAMRAHELQDDLEEVCQHQRRTVVLRRGLQPPRQVLRGNPRRSQQPVPDFLLVPRRRTRRTWHRFESRSRTASTTCEPGRDTGCRRTGARTGRSVRGDCNRSRGAAETWGRSGVASLEPDGNLGDGRRGGGHRARIRRNSHLPPFASRRRSSCRSTSASSAMTAGP